MAHTACSPLLSAAHLQSVLAATVVLDCRFALGDSDLGEAHYRQGHIPGAHYLHLERDMSAPIAVHGGRHPLPPAQQFCDRLAQLGITTATPVVAYDDSRFAYAARAWWMLRALGYSNVQVLDGGLAAWREQVGELSTQTPVASAVPPHRAAAYQACVEIHGLRKAQEQGAILIDSREEKRYQGLEEPIDPVAGHIPGALNFPWQQVSASSGVALPPGDQVQRWQALAGERELVVYCGSGVTACVNLLSLELAGRSNVSLYAGSWSDWCSWLQD